MKVTQIAPWAARFSYRTARPKNCTAYPDRMKFVAMQAKEAAAVLWENRQILLAPRNSFLPVLLYNRLLTRYGLSATRMFCCQDCGKLFYSTGYHATRLESKLCDDCEPNWVYTEDAGYVPEGDAYYSEMQDAYYSYDYDAENREEYEDEDEEPAYPYDYHNHPDRAYKKAIRSDPGDPLANDPLRLGIEWEYNSQDAVEDAHRIDELSYAFAERDGSLDSRRGLEIITGYSTLPTVTAWIKEIGSRIKIRNLDGAGLHVNISGLTALASAKFITFLNRNGNADDLEDITGRWDSGFARQTVRPLPQWYKGWTQAGSYPGTDKYSHVNVKRGFLEVRMFESNESAEVIASRTQFVWLVAKFCSQPGMDLSVSRFKHWLLENPWACRFAHEFFKCNPSFRPKSFSKLKPALKEAA